MQIERLKGFIRSIVSTVQHTQVDFFRPHVFGATIDKQLGRTLPEEVAKVVKAVKQTF
jgi:hypothetical protein